MKHTKFKTNKLITAAWTKAENHKNSKSGSSGVDLVASTMLHEKCCHTVLQIGAPIHPRGRVFLVLHITPRDVSGCWFGCSYRYLSLGSV